MAQNQQNSFYAQLLFLLLLPCFLFSRALPGEKVVSADEHLQVHHAFRVNQSLEPNHPELSDPALLIKPLRKRVIKSLQIPEVPLWNPDIYGGAPLLADGQSMVGSPVTWFHLFLSSATAQDLGVWWLLVWTGLGSMLLARRLELSSWAATLCGCGMMITPYLQVWLLHPNAAVYCWLPWFLWAIEGRRFLLVSVIVCGMIGGGHPGTIVHCFALGLVWWLVRCRNWKVLLGVFLGVGVAAPLWLPIIEQGFRSETLAARGGNVLPLRALVDMVWPTYWGHPATDSWAGDGMWSEWQLTPGMGVLFIVLWGMFAGKQDGSRNLCRQMVFFWVGCVVIALVGLPGPINHARLACLGSFFLIVAASVTVSKWKERSIFISLAIVLGTGALARSADQFRIDGNLHDPKPLAWTQELRQLVGCEEGQSNCGRVLGIGGALQPNTGSLVGLRDIRGYDLPVSQATRRLMAALNPKPQSPWFPVYKQPPRGMLQFLAIRAVVESTPTSSSPVTIEPIDIDAPRAWLAQGAFHVDSPQQALDHIAQTKDVRGRPPVENLEKELPGDQMQPLAITEIGSNVVEISLAGGDHGLLVLADAWAPGWHAAIADQRLPILRVGGYFRGVLIEESEQPRTIRFWYRPVGWVVGLWISVISLILLGILGFCTRRK